MTSPLRRADASLRCVPAADLTALAQGALPEARRAEVARHLLRCPRCHAAASGAGELFDRLRAFGAAPSWEGELGAAVAVARARARARGLGAMAGAALGLLLAAGVALLPTPPAGDAARPVAGLSAPVASAPPSARIASSRAAGSSAGAPAAPLSADARALLRAQATDGRWAADDARGSGRHDEAATGLALLAILHGRPEALRDPSVARAVAAATRWLRGRERGLEASSVALRDEAVATSALLEVYAQTGDAGVRASADRGVRRLSRELASGPALDAASADWARLALARARDLGWDRGLPPVDATPATYPLGGTPGETLVAKALALVDLTPQG